MLAVSSHSPQLKSVCGYVEGEMEENFKLGVLVGVEKEEDSPYDSSRFFIRGNFKTKSSQPIKTR